MYVCLQEDIQELRGENQTLVAQIEGIRWDLSQKSQVLQVCSRQILFICVCDTVWMHVQCNANFCTGLAFKHMSVDCACVISDGVVKPYRPLFLGTVWTFIDNIVYILTAGMLRYVFL